MQLGVDFSTSQVEKSFIGTGFWPSALAMPVIVHDDLPPTTSWSKAAAMFAWLDVNVYVLKGAGHRPCHMLRWAVLTGSRAARPSASLPARLAALPVRMLACPPAHPPGQLDRAAYSGLGRTGGLLWYLAGYRSTVATNSSCSRSNGDLIDHNHLVLGY